MNDHFDYTFGEYVADRYPGVTVSIERITPSVAQSMLGANTHNRNANRFEAISKALKNGEWSLNGASIVFSDDGVLLDGQHRLMACVKTGIAFDTIVVRGIGQRQQMTMDVGTKRKVADFLKLDGYRTRISSRQSATPYIVQTTSACPSRSLAPMRRRARCLPPSISSRTTTSRGSSR